MATLTEEERQALSKIKQLEKEIGDDEALQQQLKNGSRHAIEATFWQVAEDAFQDLVNDYFKVGCIG